MEFQLEGTEGTGCDRPMRREKGEKGASRTGKEKMLRVQIGVNSCIGPGRGRRVWMCV